MIERPAPLFFRPAPTRRRFLISWLSAQAAGLLCSPFSLLAAANAAAAVLHAGNCDEPDTLDPRLAESLAALRILYDMYLGLMMLDENGQPVPGAAESHRSFDNERRHRFVLRDSAWSSGEPVTAMDFLRGWRSALDPKVACPSAHLLGIIENGEAILRGEMPPEALGVQCPDSKTVEVTLVRPAPYFPFLLTHPVMAPAAPGNSNATAKQGKYISNGPYCVGEWRAGAHVRLVRNPHFFDQAQTSIEEIYYYNTSEDNTALQEFRTGKLDLNLRWPIALAHTANPQFKNSLRTGQLLSSDWIALNFDRAPMADQRIRRAMALAVDRKGLVSTLALGQREAYRLVPPYTPGIAATDVTVDYASRPVESRLDEARNLMAAAGYSNPRPLRLTFSSIANSEGRLIASALQSMWRKINLHVDIQLSDPNTHYGALRSGAFEISYLSWLAEIPDPYTFAAALFSDAGPYLQTGYRSDRYDYLVRRATLEWDIAERSNLFAQAEALVLEDGPLIPVLFQSSRALVSPQVQGFKDSLFDFHPARWLKVDRSRPLTAR
jgi:oligopeptide transport system substrate-binding protein